MDIEQWVDFGLQLIATLVGALLAFCANWFHYNCQKREENLTTLRFLIACLNYLLENALNLEENVAERRKEVTYHDTLKKEDLEPAKVKLMGHLLPDADLEWIIELDKLEFLASSDSNIIDRLGKAKISFLNLQSKIKDVNSDVDKYGKGEKSFYKDDAKVTIKKNKDFFKNLDDALLRTKELSNALIEFGGFEYKKDLRTLLTRATDQKYESIKPEPRESHKSLKTSD